MVIDDHKQILRQLNRQREKITYNCQYIKKKKKYYLS